MGRSMELERKRDYVRRFFGETGASYDRIVRLGTFGIDSIWKRRILERLDHPRRVLDLACGTGILSFAIAARFPRCDVTGVDITEGYLAVAREKAKTKQGSRVRFVQGWAEEFSSDRPYDAVTSSYLAKYADLPRLAKSLPGLLVPGGQVLFHDFSYPNNPALAKTWEGYMALMGRVGGPRFPEWQAVFSDLPELIRSTRWVEELSAALRQAGFIEIKVETLTLQGATLVCARRPD